MFSIKKTIFKPAIAASLALLMMLVPFTPLVEDVKAAVVSDDPLAVVYATSDFQPKDSNGDACIASGIANMEAIISQIKEDYNSENGNAITGALHAGDLSHYSKYKGYSEANIYDNSLETTKDGVEAVEYVLGKQFGLSREEIVMIQGNHDFYTSPIDYTGAHDTAEYGVYAINEKDYMYQQGSRANGEETIKKTAAELEAYFDAKIAQQYNKPIFIVNHVPLHYNQRTIKDANAYDNTYARYIFDVVNEAGAKGLTVFFLFGHNHGSGYDAYLGEASIYLKKGSTIRIPYTDGTANYVEEKLNFVYMSPGYTGYVSGHSSGVYADLTLTSTVFEIYEDRVEVKRYDANGLHNLKSKGVAISGYNVGAPDTTVIGKSGAKEYFTYDVSVDASELYPTTTVSSKRTTAVNVIDDNTKKANFVTVTAYNNKKVTMPNAQGFVAGSEGKLGLDFISGDYAITNAVSDNTAVVTVSDTLNSDGTVTVKGIDEGSATLTITAESSNGAEVVLKYDVTVFPTSLKKLQYTRYELVNAVANPSTRPAIYNTSNPFYTTSKLDGINQPTEGKTYIFVNAYTNPNNWGYALIDNRDGTATSRNVAVYGTPTPFTATSGSRTVSGFEGGSFVDSCDPLMEWTYVEGKLRNNATGKYLIAANDGTLKTSDSKSNTNQYSSFYAAGYGIDFRKAGCSTAERRYLRYTTQFGVELDTTNTVPGVDQRYSQNVFLYEKVTNGATGAYAWVDTTEINAFVSDLDGVTNATLYISDGINVTPVPVTLNMISAAVDSSTSAGAVFTGCDIIYDGVAVVSGVKLTMRAKPTWTKDADETVKIGNAYTVTSSASANGAASVSYSYESLTPACATVSNNGEVTGKAVGGSLIKVTATFGYSNGTFISDTDEVYVTVVPTTASYKTVRTYGNNTVYVPVHSVDPDAYNTSTGKTDGSYDRFIVVSSNSAGEAFAMRNNSDTMNNIEASPIMVESYNGVHFIQDTGDPALLWFLTHKNAFSTKAFTGYGFKTGTYLANKNYYQLQSARTDINSTLILNTLTNLRNSQYSSGRLDGGTNLLCGIGGSSYVGGIVSKVFPKLNGVTTTYTDGASSWTYAQKNVGFSCINYRTDGSHYTYVLTYDEADGRFEAVMHDNMWPSGINNQFHYENRVYAYLPKTVETSGVIIWIDKGEGTVSAGATAGAKTGATINVTTHSPNGTTTVSYPLTYGMLSKSGMTTNVNADTTYENVAVTYTHNGKKYTLSTAFELNVID